MPKHYWKMFDAQWFNDHQSVILWLVNAIWPLRTLSRWMLRVTSALPICKITPSSYTTILGNGHRKSVFYTHAKHSKRVYYALAPLWWTLHFLDWAILDWALPALSFGFGTLTAYPQVSGGGGNVTCDGYVELDGYGTWAQFHDATDGSTASTTAATAISVQVKAAAGASSYVNIRRSAYTFDTSAIGVGESVLSADFYLYATAKAQTFPGYNTGIYLVNYGATANNITIADFDQFGVASYGSVTWESITLAAYNAIALNGDGVLAVNVTGVTTLGLRQGNDFANIAPTWASNAVVSITSSYVDETGTGQDPYLEVEHTGGGSTGATSSIVGYGNHMAV